jgi:hypothetical protein
MLEESKTAVIGARDFSDQFSHIEAALNAKIKGSQEDLANLSRLKREFPDQDESISPSLARQIEQENLTKALIVSVKSAIEGILNFMKKNSEAQSEIKLAPSIQEELDINKAALEKLRAIQSPQNTSTYQSVIEALEKNLAELEKTIKGSENRRKYEEMIADFQRLFRDKLSAALAVEISFFVSHLDRSPKVGPQPTHCLEVTKAVFDKGGDHLALSLKPIETEEESTNT